MNDSRTSEPGYAFAYYRWHVLQFGDTCDCKGWIQNWVSSRICMRQWRRQNG